MKNRVKQYSSEQRQVLNTWTKIVRCVGSVGQSDFLIMTDHGLTPTQFGILETLYHKGSMCQKELGEKLLKSGGNITKVIDNLERDNHVRRVRDERDRRYFKIELTENGIKVIEEVFPKIMNNLVKYFSVLTQDEQKTLADLSKRVGLSLKGKRNDSKS